MGHQRLGSNRPGAPSLKGTPWGQGGHYAVPEPALCPQENTGRLSSGYGKMQWVQIAKRNIVVMHSHTPAGVSK